MCCCKEHASICNRAYNNEYPDSENKSFHPGTLNRKCSCTFYKNEG